MNLLKRFAQIAAIGLAGGLIAACSSDSSSSSSSSDDDKASTPATTTGGGGSTSKGGSDAFPRVSFAPGSTDANNKCNGFGGIKAEIEGSSPQAFEYFCDYDFQHNFTKNLNGGGDDSPLEPENINATSDKIFFNYNDEGKNQVGLVQDGDANSAIDFDDLSDGTVAGFYRTTASSDDDKRLYIRVDVDGAGAETVESLYYIDESVSPRKAVPVSDVPHIQAANNKVFVADSGVFVVQADGGVYSVGGTDGVTVTTHTYAAITGLDTGDIAVGAGTTDLAKVQGDTLYLPLDNAGGAATALDADSLGIFTHGTAAVATSSDINTAWAGDENKALFVADSGIFVVSTDDDVYSLDGATLTTHTYGDIGSLASADVAVGAGTTGLAKVKGDTLYLPLDDAGGAATALDADSLGAFKHGTAAAEDVADITTAWDGTEAKALFVAGSGIFVVSTDDQVYSVAVSDSNVATVTTHTYAAITGLGSADIAVGAGTTGLAKVQDDTLYLPLDNANGAATAQDADSLGIFAHGTAAVATSSINTAWGGDEDKALFVAGSGIFVVSTDDNVYSVAVDDSNVPTVTTHTYVAITGLGSADIAVGAGTTGLAKVKGDTLYLPLDNAGGAATTQDADSLGIFTHGTAAVATNAAVNTAWAGDEDKDVLVTENGVFVVSDEDGIYYFRPGSSGANVTGIIDAADVDKDNFKVAKAAKGALSNYAFHESAMILGTNPAVALNEIAISADQFVQTTNGNTYFTINGNFDTGLYAHGVTDTIGIRPAVTGSAINATAVAANGNDVYFSTADNLFSFSAIATTHGGSVTDVSVISAPTTTTSSAVDKNKNLEKLVFVEDQLYALKSNKVYALNDTGELDEVQTDDETPASISVNSIHQVGDQLIAVGSSNVYSISGDDPAATEIENTTGDTPASLTGAKWVAVAGDVLFFNTGDNNLWLTQGDSDSTKPVRRNGNNVTWNLTAQDNKAVQSGDDYYTLWNGFLYWVNESTGVAVRASTTNRELGTESVQGLIALKVGDADAIAITTRSGAVKVLVGWKGKPNNKFVNVNTGGTWNTAKPYFVGDRLYFTGKNGLGIEWYYLQKTIPSN